MTQPEPPKKSSEPARPAKPRINTQIHRRQKAKAVPPMQDEWDDQSTTPPDLRTPSSKMKKKFEVDLSPSPCPTAPDRKTENP